MLSDRRPLSTQRDACIVVGLAKFIRALHMGMGYNQPATTADDVEQEGA